MNDDISDDPFPASNENAQYHMVITSETEAQYDAFLWDEQVRKIIELIENS